MVVVNGGIHEPIITQEWRRRKVRESETACGGARLIVVNVALPPNVRRALPFRQVFLTYLNLCDALHWQ
jgi:hypothetical protein